MDDDRRCGRPGCPDRWPPIPILTVDRCIHILNVDRQFPLVRDPGTDPAFLDMLCGVAECITEDDGRSAYIQIEGGRWLRIVPASEEEHGWVTGRGEPR